MAVNLSPVGGAAAQFFDNSGNVLTGGKLYTYSAGTTTPAVTYTTNAGTTPHANPIVLNAAGRVPDSGEIWLSDSISYKFVLKDQNDVLIATYDNLIGINSNFVNFTGEEETQTATQGQTIFTLTTIQYQPATNNLLVFVNGSKQVLGDNFTETSSTEVTFVDGLNVGDVVDFCTATPINTAIVNANAVVYDPPFTNSVITNVQNELAQYISVKDFGATGDGVTDDTAAFVAAKDYVGQLGGGIIHIPIGIYVLTDFDIDYRSVLFEGETSGYGYESVTNSVQLIPSATAVYVVRLKGTRGVITSGASSYSGLKNLRIKFATGTCNYGLFIDTGSTLLEEVDIQGFPYGCVLATLANSNRFTNCSFTLNTEVGFAVPDSGSASTYMFTDVPDIPTGTNVSTTWSMVGCTIRQNNFGMVIRESSNVTIENCVFEANTQAGLYVYRLDTSTLRGITLNNCWFENNYDGYVSGSTSYSVTGNKLFTLGSLSSYIAWTSIYQAGYQFVIDSQTHAGGGPDTFIFSQVYVSANIADQMGFFIIAGFKFEFIQPVFAGANNTTNFLKAANTAEAIVYIDPLSANNPTTTIPSLANGNGMGSTGAYYRSATTNDGTPADVGGLYPVKGVFGGPVRFPAPVSGDPRLNDVRTLDDYLESTCSLTYRVTGATPFTVNSQTNTFTKVGNIVRLQMVATITVSSAFGFTDKLYITGLPYLANSTGALVGSCWVQATGGGATINDLGLSSLYMLNTDGIASLQDIFPALSVGYTYSISAEVTYLAATAP